MKVKQSATNYDPPIGESTILDGFVYLYKAGWGYFRAAIPVVIARDAKVYPFPVPDVTSL